MAKKNEELLNATEVCVLVGISVYTLKTWCKFKQAYPNHELAKLIPLPTQEHARGPRKWKRSDVEKLLEFKARRPRGRNGIMGEFQPQRRIKNGKETNKRKTNRTTKTN